MKTGHFVAALAAMILLFAAVQAQAQSFDPVPTRTIGPNSSGQAGSWTPTDDRTVGAPLTGQHGWTAQKSSEGPLLDDEVTSAAAHSGNQSLRISNWFTSASVDSIISPAFAPGGETGASSNSGAPVTNTVTYSFWFRSASTTADPGMSFTTQLSRLASYRLTYLAFLDTASSPDGQCTNPPTGFHLKTIGIITSDGTPTGSTVFTHHCSPTLTRGAWYKAVITATFNDGQLNDVIETDVFDDSGSPVWTDQSASWEYAYKGVFNNYGPFAADHVTFDLSASTGPGPSGEYAAGSAAGTQGIYFDDMAVVPGDGAAGYATSFNGERWVDSTGSDTSNDCSVQISPCGTIAHAIAEAAAGNTIHIANGTYTAPLTVSKDGLKLVGEDPNDKPVITRINGGINQPLLVIDGAKNVEVHNLEFGMDQSFVAEGILASGFVDGLVIDNNHFVDSRTSPSVNSSYPWRNAIAINFSRNSLSLPRVNGSTVTVANNTIDGLADVANGVFLRSGIQMDAGNGTISNNTITAGVQDIQARFASATTASGGDTLTIDGNHTFGRGIDVSSPNGSISQITVSNNDVHAVTGIDDLSAYPADWSLMRLMHNSAGVDTLLSGNTFSGHEGSYRGVLVENYPGIAFTGNTFSPAPGASDFVSLVVSNKEITTDNPPSAPLSMSLTAQDNTFNGSGVAGVGTAVEFLNDNDAGGTASFGSLIFGGSGTGEANSFDGDLRWYFHLDDYDCDTVNTPTCSFLDYDGAIGSSPGTNTEVRAFTGNVSASDNTFDGVAPSAMTPAQQNALTARTYDSTANSALGTVDYGLSATAPVIYVDDDYAAGPHNYGDPLPFTSTAAGSTTAYWQIDAFATIPDGVTHVDAGGTVYVAKGSYANAVTLSKDMELIGDGNDASGTVLSQGITVSASGSSTSSPLLVQNLRVSDPAANHNGIMVSQAVSHLALQGLALVGNGNAGINLNRDVTDVSIADSLVDGNKVGMRTSSTVHADQVAITDTTFSNNSIAGLLLFGGSYGSGSVTNWTVDGSTFATNDNSDTTSWGGGIQLNSYGPSTVVDGFAVSNSTFADNGAKPSIQFKRGGIIVDAENGGVLKNVSICSNSFVDNAGTPGTQANGIFVYDGTNNTTYEPITVCADNTFTGGDHSISGKKQHDKLGSQPVVNITGGTIANTEYINQPVKNVDTGEMFATITEAINDADTVNGNTIDAPAGLYAENVVVNKSVTIQGAFAGTPGSDGSRSGPGETTIQPASGYALKFMAPDSTVSGFTIKGSVAGGSAITLSGANANNLTLTDNRIIDITDGAGITSEPGTDCKADGFDIENNLFSNITGGGAINGRGIRLGNGHCNVDIVNNDFDAVVYAVNANGGGGTVQDLTITDNRVQNTTGTAFVITNTTRTLLQHNTVTAAAGGLFISDEMTDFTASCNAISTTGNGISTLDFFGGTANTGVRIFDNAISAATDVKNNLAQTLTVGSNWYGGGSASVDGGNAAGINVADPLSATPIGQATCGDNTATQIVAHAGSGQHATVNGAFANPLGARVVDALGGAVMGQTVNFTAPASGASATLGTASGTTDYNGVLSTTATANATAGTYSVTATSGSLAPDASFALTNDPAAATITLDAGTLSTIYDGNAHAVTATTVPAGLSYEVTYDGNPTAPVNAGSYNVVATVTEPNYTTASDSGTLTISKASGTVVWDQLAFTYDGNAAAVTAHIGEEPATSCTVTPGTVGPAAGSYPVSATCTGTNYDASSSDTAVISPATATLTLSNLSQSYDGSPKPVTVTTTPPGVGYSVTYNGSATAPSAVGDYAVVASVDDPNYNGTQASGVLHITGAPLTDANVTITDYRDYAQYGHALVYAIVVNNVGNQDISGATVNAILPASLLPMQPKSWFCYDSDKGRCSAPSGSGDLSTTVDVDAGGSVTLVLNAYVNQDHILSTGQIELAVTVSASGDSNAANDSATDTTLAVIFRDGSELDSDGAQVPVSVIEPGNVLSLSGSNSRMLDLSSAWGGRNGLVELARLRNGNSDRVQVQALRTGKQLLVRLVGQIDGEVQASAWSVVKPGTAQLALGMAQDDSRSVLLLIGSGTDLQLQLSDNAGALQVWGPPATKS